MKRNPAKEVGYLKSKKKGGFHTWSTEEVAIYLDRHGPGTKARLALGVILLSGQRRSDVVLFGKQHLREARFMPENLQAFHSGRWIAFTQHKNRNKSPVTLTIPVLPELDHLLAEDRRAPFPFSKRNSASRSPPADSETGSGAGATRPACLIAAPTAFVRPARQSPPTAVPPLTNSWRFSAGRR